MLVERYTRSPLIAYVFSMAALVFITNRFVFNSSITLMDLLLVMIVIYVPIFIVIIIRKVR